MEESHTMKKSRSLPQSIDISNVDNNMHIDKGNTWQDSPHRRKKMESRDYLKDMVKLDSNDEAFSLPWRFIHAIINLIKSRKTPTREICSNWDSYAKSFYLKMCDCFGLDYQHLKKGDGHYSEVDHNVNPQPPEYPWDTIICFEKEWEDDKAKAAAAAAAADAPPSPPLSPSQYKNYKGLEELLEQLMAAEDTQEDSDTYEEDDITGLMPSRSGPYESGVYSPGNEPDCIPYHLYLLIKEAVNVTDSKALKIAERKIEFFCKHFHSHLPAGWNYERECASSLIADYDTTLAKSRLERVKTCFTPYKKLDRLRLDLETWISESDTACIMTMIYLRSMPAFDQMHPDAIRLYCLLCSCFGISYDRLQDAFEDDLCLMNVGADISLRSDK